MKRSIVGYSPSASASGKSVVHKPRRLLPETFVNSEGNTVPMEISVPINIIEDIIQQELKCPICLDTIQQTSSVTACLHRFCEDCLHKSLRGNLNSAKEHHDCPSCRFKLPSKRSTRADADFDSIIQVLTTAMKRQLKNVHPSHPPPKDTLATRSKAQPEQEENFDIREFQRSHQAAITEFRAKQQGKKKEAQLQLRMLQHQLLEQRQLSSSRNISLPKKSSSKQHQQHQPLQSSNNAKVSYNKKVSSPTPVVESPPRINLAIFPFTSIDDHKHGHDTMQMKKLLAGQKRPRSPSWSEGFASVTNLALLDNNIVSSSSSLSTLPPMELPYLRVPPMLTILALKQYISARLSLTIGQVARLEVVFIDCDPHENDSSNNNNEDAVVVVLEDQLAMREVVSMHWRGRGKFHLYYRLKPVDEHVLVSEKENEVNHKKVRKDGEEVVIKESEDAEAAVGTMGMDEVTGDINDSISNSGDKKKDEAKEKAVISPNDL